MSISNRIKNITAGGSDGWGVFNRARKMISNGEKVIGATQGGCKHGEMYIGRAFHVSDLKTIAS